MLTTLTVDWTDPRVAELHAGLAAETGALYRTVLAKLPREEREAALGSLAIDPAVIETTLLTLDGDTPVATAAVRRSIASDTEWDVKRVFVVEDHRGRGISRALMEEIHEFARTHGATTMVLQTGPQQAPAIGLYKSLGYEPCEPYPPYGFYPGELTFRKVL
ncbi:MAG: GNAT family N-acetyltransferase [Pseudolysinimonas sp.]